MIFSQTSNSSTFRLITSVSIHLVWTGQKTAAARRKRSGKYPFPHNIILFNVNTQHQILSLPWLLAFRRPKNIPMKILFKTILFLHNIATTTNQTPPTQHGKLQPLFLPRLFKIHCSSQTRSESVCAKVSSACKPVVSFCKRQRAGGRAQSFRSSSLLC